MDRRIKCVTMTGADESISPEELLKLSREFPFVEWGILASYNNTIINQGSRRYPSLKWITDLQGIAETTGSLQLSLHINGTWVRKLLVGKIDIPEQLFHCFRRIQLNFHAEKTTCNPRPFSAALKTIGKEFVFQLDGNNGNEHLESAMSEDVKNCFGLFDVSGGAGILPNSWPLPIYLDVFPGEHGEGVEQYAYHGYAGGLGPDNLAAQIPLILKEAKGIGETQPGKIWIDMETRIRSHNDSVFDLKKVRKCLEIAKPYIAS